MCFQDLPRGTSVIASLIPQHFFQSGVNNVAVQVRKNSAVAKTTPLALGSICWVCSYWDWRNGIRISICPDVTSNVCPEKSLIEAIVCI